MNTYDPDHYGELIYGMGNHDYHGDHRPNAPQVARVDIEEVDGDLWADVKTRNLEDVDLKPPVYRSVYRGTTKTDSDSVYVVNLETFCRIGDLDSRANLWSVFQLRALTLQKSTYYQVANANNNYVKVCQSFHVTVAKNDCVPYIQFVCEVARAKYRGCWFHKGDIINCVVRHKDMPRDSDPQIISVRPRAEQTYVAMLPKHKLQIITDPSQSDLEFNASSSLVYRGQEVIEPEYVEKNHVRCDLFECVDIPREQELFFVNSRTDNTCKVICIPALLGGDYLLIGPVKTCRLYPGVAEGFVLRTHRDMKFTTENNCALRVVYTVYRNNYCETRVKIIKPQPFFILERAKQYWVAKNEGL